MAIDTNTNLPATGVNPAPAQTTPWMSGLAATQFMGKDIYGQDNKWYMDNEGTQQDITGLYNNYQGYQGIDNGLAAGMMLQGNENRMVQGWDGKFYSDMFPEFRRHDSIGYDGYDFKDSQGNQHVFNKDGTDVTDYLGWKATPQNHIGLAAKIFGPSGDIIKGNKDQVFSKYGLVVGGLNQNKDFVRDESYVPDDGYYSSMYNSISDPDFSVRDYQMYADSDPLATTDAKQFFDASHGAGWNPILSPTDPILIDKTAYDEGYETWGRFSKYLAPQMGGKKGTSYWNYYPEADTADQWNAGSVGDYARLGKSAGGHFEQYSPSKLNSDLKSATWLKDQNLGTGFAFSEDKKNDYGYAPSTGSMDLKKTPAYKQWIGPILTVLSFIPGVNVVAAPLAAAYNVGMGIKNGNWAQAVGGVIGMPGVGQAMGLGTSTIGGAMSGGLSQMANISPALANAIISGGLGAINGGWEGALAGGLGSYAGSYVGSSIGDATQNYDLGMTAGGLTNSMLNQLINTGQLNEEQLMTQGLTGALNAYLKSA